MTALVFSRISQSASSTRAITNRQLVDTFRFTTKRNSSKSEPASMKPCRKCVKLYGSSIVCDVSEPHASDVQKKDRHSHPHDLPWRRSWTAVPTKIRTINTTGQIFSCRCLVKQD